MPLGPGPLTVGLLLITGGDVVRAGEPEDDVQSPLHRDIPAQTPDDDRKLTLVVDPLAVGGKDDRVTGADHARRGLQKEQRALRRGVATHLPGMVGIVLADAQHLARQHRRQQPHVAEHVPRAGEAERTEGMGGDRGHRGLTPLEGTFHDPEGRFRPVGEPGDTHPSTVQAAISAPGTAACGRAI